MPVLLLVLSACGLLTADPTPSVEPAFAPPAPALILPRRDPAAPSPGMREVQLPARRGTAEKPKLVTFEDGIGMAWREDYGDTLLFTKLAHTGEPQTAPVPLYQGRNARDAVAEGRFDVAVAGDVILMVWQAEGVFFSIGRADGTMIVPPRLVSEDRHRGFPAAASNGVDFMLAYTTQRATMSGSDIMALRVDAQGRISREIKLTDTGVAFTPDVAFHPGSNSWGVVWRHDVGRAPEIWFAGLKGAEVATPARQVTAPDGRQSDEPAIAAFRDGFALASQDYRSVVIPAAGSTSGTPHVRLSLLSPSGIVKDLNADGQVDLEDEVRISNPVAGESDPPALAVANDRIGFVWAAQARPFDVYFAEAVVPTDGRMRVSEPHVVDKADVAAQNPTIAVDAEGRWLMAWEDERGGGVYQLYAGVEVR